MFGTIVTGRSVIANALATAATQALNSPSASIPSSVRLQVPNISWRDFAHEWRMSDEQFTSNYDNSTSSPFVTLDQHHHSSLLRLLAKHGLDGLWTDNTILELSRIWHYLDGWPDSSPGLRKLNEKFPTCTLSNGNVELLQDMAKHADHAWTFIFSSEHFQAYKRSPAVYLGAAQKLNIPPSECALVAAHLTDLEAARSHGYQTVYVEREGEELLSDEEVKKVKADGWVDMWIGIEDRAAGGGLLEIAKRFEGV